MHDILIRARELIADPANWIQGHYSDGEIADPETKCFCIIGAVDRAVIEKRGFELFRDISDSAVIDHIESDPDTSAAIKVLQEQLPKTGMVSDFNDSPETTHADVLALLDKAIAA
jgi:hypothetical protein